MTIGLDSKWRSNSSGAIIRVFKVELDEVHYLYIPQSTSNTYSLETEYFLDYFTHIVDMDYELELLD